MSSPREFSLTFEIAPPPAVRPGLPFTVPVIVAVRPIITPSSTAVQLVASASLRDEAGTSAAIGLGGNLTAMVRSHAEPSMSGYAKFAGLTVSRPGKFRIRVMLSTSSVNGVITKECLDSGVIHVHAAAPAAQRPTPTTVAKLQRLTAENLDITMADIAMWQSA